MALGKVSVNALRGKLYLLAMLPAKDGSGAIRQARIPLSLYDEPADRKVAEKRRALLQRQVDTNTFDWADWTEVTRRTTWRQAIDQLFRKRMVYGRTSESTWNINYMGRLRQLPMGKVVTTSMAATAKWITRLRSSAGVVLCRCCGFCWLYACRFTFGSGTT